MGRLQDDWVQTGHYPDSSSDSTKFLNLYSGTLISWLYSLCSSPVLLIWNFFYFIPLPESLFQPDYSMVLCDNFLSFNFIPICYFALRLHITLTENRNENLAFEGFHSSLLMPIIKILLYFFFVRLILVCSLAGLTLPPYCVVPVISKNLLFWNEKPCLQGL